jgi:hypothetical protein
MNIFETSFIYLQRLEYSVEDAKFCCKIHGLYLFKENNLNKLKLKLKVKFWIENLAQVLLERNSFLWKTCGKLDSVIFAATFDAKNEYNVMCGLAGHSTKSSSNYYSVRSVMHFYKNININNEHDTKLKITIKNIIKSICENKISLGVVSSYKALLLCKSKLNEK